MVSLIQTASFPGPVFVAFYGIKWYHDFNGLESQTNSKLVVNVLKAAKRIFIKTSYVDSLTNLGMQMKFI